MHNSADIDVESGNRCRPEIISFYNMTEGGVDMVDKLKMEYSVSRNSRRWPLTTFFTLLNIAGINTQIIYKSNTNILMPRRKFLKIITRDLVLPCIQQRLHCHTLSIELRTLMTKFLKSNGKEVENTNTNNNNRGKCSYCPKYKNRKTNVHCINYDNLICGEHKITICSMCYLNEKEDE